MGTRKARVRRACGQILARDGGVDVACVRDGRMHTMRFRFCMDARRRVHLLGTGVVDGAMTRTDATGSSLSVSPRRHRQFVRQCMLQAAPFLRQALRSYVERMPPTVRRDLVSIPTMKILHA